MLEIKTYSLSTIKDLLSCRTRQQAKRKLDNYEVEYKIEGNGNNASIEIQAINNPLKLYCILDLGFTAQTDFEKLKYFLYYFLNDEEFRAMPDEVMETRMHHSGHPVSRQTIANYRAKLQAKDIIFSDISEYIYYFAYKDKQTITTREIYNRAWREYWKHVKEEGFNSGIAIAIMRYDYKGIARKQPKVYINAIYQDDLTYLNELVINGIESDFDTNI